VVEYGSVKLFAPAPSLAMDRFASRGRRGASRRGQDPRALVVKLIVRRRPTSNRSLILIAIFVGSAALAFVRPAAPRLSKAFEQRDLRRCNNDSRNVEKAPER